ncbi:hypothetical protein D3C81_1082820 [compost metagenome]
MAGQEVLGESLGAFQLGCALGWAKAVQAAAAEQVDDTGNQRAFRADDGQGDVFLSEIGQLFQGGNVDVDILALGFGGGAGVAWGNENLFDPWVLGNFPGQGVFTTTATDNQNFHVKTSMTLILQSGGKASCASAVYALRGRNEVGGCKAEQVTLSAVASWQ